MGGGGTAALPLSSRVSVVMAATTAAAAAAGGGRRGATDRIRQLRWPLGSARRGGAVVFCSWSLVTLCVAPGWATYTMSPCDKALTQNCAAARNHSLLACTECAGSHQSGLKRAGCDQAAILGFCSANSTCAEQLYDKCVGTQESCIQCSACARQQDVCTAEQQGAFCEQGCDRNLQCNLALESVCDAARVEDEMDCYVCAGQHQSTMQQANCSNSIVTDFCTNASCVAKLSSRCARRACLDCVQCAAVAGLNNMTRTGCRQNDVNEFCEATALSLNTNCDTTLVTLCNSTRHVAGMHAACLKCASANKAAVDAAKCSATQITHFCSGFCGAIPPPPPPDFYRRSSLPKQPSVGCSNASSGWISQGLAKPGESSVHEIEVGGVKRHYRVHLPTSYRAEYTLPLVLAFHGYSDLAEEFEIYSAFSLLSDTLAGNLSYVVAYPQGLGDINADADPQHAQDWYSWNGGGCNDSPGPQGETCAQSQTGNTPDYGVPSLNYQSCFGSKQQPGHWVSGAGGTKQWVSSYCNACTCVDDERFVYAMVAEISTQLCIDRRRVYVTGFSWGSMFAYHIALKMSSDFIAAAAPVSGGVLKGFDTWAGQVSTATVEGHMPRGRRNRSFLTAAAAATDSRLLPKAFGMMDIHGCVDTEVPSNATAGSNWSQSFDGWWYTPVDVLLHGFATRAQCAQAQPASWQQWQTPWISAKSDWLNCVGTREGDCHDDVEVVRCVWNSYGHTWPAFGEPFDATNTARLIWGFLARHALAQPAVSA